MRITPKSLCFVATLLSVWFSSVACAQNEDPDTLFLTWFDDPTTTIVAQWLEQGEPLGLAEGASNDVPAFGVPKATDIQTDGDPSDWDNTGLALTFLADRSGRVYGNHDLNASAKLAWSNDGLHALIRVRDDVADVSNDPNALTQADSIECFVSTGVGATQRYQLVITPGINEAFSKDQLSFIDRREDKQAGELTAECATRAVDGGYVVEVMLPWANLGLDPAEGATAGFQLYINDKDKGEHTKSISWHPQRDSHVNPGSVYPLRLTDKPGRPSMARSMVYRDNNEAVWVMWGRPVISRQARRRNER